MSLSEFLQGMFFILLIKNVILSDEQLNTQNFWEDFGGSPKGLQ